MTPFEREWEKMLSGEVYDAQMPEFHERLARARHAMRRFNDLPPLDLEAQHVLLKSLFGRIGEKFTVNQPFRCDYGCNIFIGENFFANFNLTILDEAKVTIGDNCFIGPNVSIYTACHPLNARERATGVEWAEPVTVGNDVWIGGGATLLPGVTVGDGAVIAAGAVVTRPVEPYTLVGGNPARFIKKVD